jgi:hypothetical protein
MPLWPTTLRITREEVKLLVTSPLGDDLLKARLPIRSRHPRALCTLLEGVALWSGEPVYAVISAGKYCAAWLGSEHWGESLWPEESVLVQFDLAVPQPRRRRTLRGLGDFRDVRRQLRVVRGGA